MWKNFKTAFVLLLALFAFSAVGEAAATHSVHHRPRHSSRVATGSPTAKKKSTSKKKTTNTKPHPKAPSHSKTTTKPK